MGYAVHHATGGGQDGFEIWDNWSRLSDKYGVKDKTDVTWRRIDAAIAGGNPKRTRGAGTIFFLAAKAGLGCALSLWDLPGTLMIQAGNEGGDAGKAEPILDTPAFLATFTMPDYLVDGIIQRGRPHALTYRPPGTAKTAVALFLALGMMATARNIGALEVTQGNILFLAGENPDDLSRSARTPLAMPTASCPAWPPIYFMPGNFPLDPEAGREAESTNRRNGDHVLADHR